MTTTGPAQPAGLATPAEVAKHLTVDVTTLAAWRYKGQGPVFVKLGARVAYLWSDVEAWVESQRHTRTDIAVVSA